MTAHHIRQVALAHFAQYGYDGTSLSKIADEVGIKKPSIYAHYASKEDLFLQVVQLVFDQELLTASQFFKEHRGQPLEWQMNTFLYSYLKRYEQQSEIKFMIRMSLFPPAALEKQVMKRVNAFLDQLEHDLVPIIILALQSGEIAAVQPEQAATAFMCMLDGLYAELLYGDTERFKRKLDRSWYIYWRGLTLKA
ncbi:TetR/AcrR family transcriptional regulator [Paenibacillus marinisediminis]